MSFFSVSHTEQSPFETALLCFFFFFFPSEYGYAACRWLPLSASVLRWELSNTMVVAGAGRIMGLLLLLLGCLNRSSSSWCEIILIIALLSLLRLGSQQLFLRRASHRLILLRLRWRGGTFALWWTPPRGRWVGLCWCVLDHGGRIKCQGSGLVLDRFPEVLWRAHSTLASPRSSLQYAATVVDSADQWKGDPGQSQAVPENGGKL